MKPEVRTIYIGKPCRLGRFGPVAFGDEVVMTTKEYAGATDDEANAARFHRLAKDAKVPEKIAKEAEKQRQERIEAAADSEGKTEEQAATDEINRQERIDKENGHEKNRNLELQHMNKEELREKVAKLRNSGSTIHAKTGASKRELIAAILTATDNGE